MIKGTESFYNRFSIFYPLVDLFLRTQKKVLFHELGKVPSGDLLDVGVGSGSHLKYYKDHQVTGIDTSSKMLEIAAKKKNEDVKLLIMNGESLLFANESFDYVVLSHVIAVVDNPDKLLTEVARVLKSKGQVFIFNHFTPHNWLKYIDIAVQPLSKKLKFNSVFSINDLKALEKYSLLKEVNSGPYSYFKLLVLQKK